MASDFTQLLVRVREGDEQALGALFDLVYAELRRVASRHLAAQAPSPTLHTTALVHEAYLKLVRGAPVTVEDRRHFFALAARAMRLVVVDYFRSRNAGKRRGERASLDLTGGEIPIEDRGAVILDVHDALDRLAALDPRMATVVEYRYFGGMTEPEIGEALGVSERTVRGDWRKARAWLARELAGG